MDKRKDLATIVNNLSDADLASLSRDEALIRAEGLVDLPRQPDIEAALRRLALRIFHRPRRRRRLLH